MTRRDGSLGGADWQPRRRAGGMATRRLGRDEQKGRCTMKRRLLVAAVLMVVGIWLAATAVASAGIAG